MRDDMGPVRADWSWVRDTYEGVLYFERPTVADAVKHAPGGLIYIASGLNCRRDLLVNVSAQVAVMGRVGLAPALVFNRLRRCDRVVGGKIGPQWGAWRSGLLRACQSVLVVGGSDVPVAPEIAEDMAEAVHLSLAIAMIGETPCRIV